MAEYDNTNTGALFKNEKRATERHPNYTGSLNVGGHDYWISAWLKKDRNDKGYMSLSVKLKDGKPREQAKPVSQTLANADMDDEIPFAAEFR